MRALDAVGAALERAETSQADLNAFTLIDREGALRRAATIDELVRGGADPGPLAGVPVAIKDLVDQAGLPNTRGAAFEAPVPDRSATIVERIERAGAVIVGRAGLHEFAYGFTSENEHFGPVRNPWDPALSPGGSSGGSGAAVASGVVPLAIGTDTGGSVRVPAALCGIVGLKVTHGRVPLTGVYPLAAALDTVGPMARTVADAAALYLAVAGDDPADPWSAPRSVSAPERDAALAELSVGVPVEWAYQMSTSDVERSFQAVIEALRTAGAHVEEFSDPRLTENEAADRAAGVEAAAVHRARWLAEPERYGSLVATRLRAAMEVPAADLVAATEWAAATRHSLERRFTQFDVMITPTVGGTVKRIGDEDMDIDGTAVFHRRVLAAFTAPLNRIGVPALALPLPSDSKPPVSIQLIGPAWGEARLLEIGSALESAGIAAVARPPHWFGE